MLLLIHVMRAEQFRHYQAKFVRKFNITSLVFQQCKKYFIMNKHVIKERTSLHSCLELYNNDTQIEPIIFILFCWVSPRLKQSVHCEWIVRYMCNTAVVLHVISFKCANEKFGVDYCCPSGNVFSFSFLKFKDNIYHVF